MSNSSTLVSMSFTVEQRTPVVPIRGYDVIHHLTRTINPEPGKAKRKSSPPPPLPHPVELRVNGRDVTVVFDEKVNASSVPARLALAFRCSPDKLIRTS